jgi:hypothetical protein
VSWLDWSLLDRHRDLHQFVRKLIAHRLRLLSAGDEESFGLSLNQLLRRAEIDWHGVQLGRPDWSDSSHSLALTARPRQRQIPLWLHVMFNAYWEALDFELPLAPAAGVAGWQRWIDTSLESPEDIMDAAAAPSVPGTQYRVAWSVRSAPGPSWRFAKAAVVPTTATVARPNMPVTAAIGKPRSAIAVAIDWPGLCSPRRSVRSGADPPTAYGRVIVNVLGGIQIGRAMP